MKGKIALLRLNLNVPLKDGMIVDDFRIKTILQTVAYAAGRAKKTVIIAHLGRPQRRDPQCSLMPVARRMQELLGQEVRFLSDCVGREVEHHIEDAPDGTIFLLENLRFHEGERKNDKDFGCQLARLGHVFVNDAFADSYESYASVIWPPKLMPAAAGFRLQQELGHLNSLRDEPEQPFVILVGGAKIKEKMGALRVLGEKADTLLMGGAIANTLFAAQGYKIGASLVQPEELDLAKQLMEEFSGKIILPSDVAVAEKKEGEIVIKTLKHFQMRHLEEQEAILDIGPASVAAYKGIVQKAKTIFWAGPMGYIEEEQTRQGSYALIETLSVHSGMVLIGGGETGALIADLGMLDEFDFISTGGSAALKFLSGESLPGIEALG